MKSNPLSSSLPSSPSSFSSSSSSSSSSSCSSSPPPPRRQPRRRPEESDYPSQSYPLRRTGLSRCFSGAVLGTVPTPQENANTPTVGPPEEGDYPSQSYPLRRTRLSRCFSGSFLGPCGRPAPEQPQNRRSGTPRPIPYPTRANFLTMGHYFSPVSADVAEDDKNDINFHIDNQKRQHLHSHDEPIYAETGSQPTARPQRPEKGATGAAFQATPAPDSSVDAKLAHSASTIGALTAKLTATVTETARRKCLCTTRQSASRGSCLLPTGSALRASRRASCPPRLRRHAGRDRPTHGRGREIPTGTPARIPAGATALESHD